MKKLVSFLLVSLLISEGCVASKQDNLQGTQQQMFLLEQFTAEVLRSQMQDCNLLVLFEANKSSEILDYLPQMAKGIILIEISQLKSGQLLYYKKLLQNKESTVCLSILVSYSDSMDSILIDVGKKFWHGNNKILFITMPNSKSPVEGNLFLNKSFQYSNRIYVAEKSSESSLYIFMVLQFKGKDRTIIELFSRWSLHSGFSKNVEMFSEKYNKNFRGYNFTIAAKPRTPFVIENDVTKPGPGKYRGLEPDLVEIVAQGGNLTYYYIAPPDGQWGKKLSDGNWTGMIGLVGREEAHWAMCDITFTLARYGYVDFTQTIMNDIVELITPKAKRLPQWLGPILPFSKDVWIAVVIITFGIIVLLHIIAKISSNATGKRNLFTDFGIAFLFCIQVILMRGNRSPVYEHSSRLFIASWIISATIINIFYTSSLTSFLISPGYSKSIQNFEELISSDITWSKVNLGGSHYDYLKSATEPTLVALFQGLKMRKTSLENIMKEIVAGKTSTWDSAITAHLEVAVKYSDDNGNPMVYFTGTPFLYERVVWPIQKHAPYKMRLDEILTAVTESGLLEKFYSDIMFEERILAKQKQLQKKGQSNYTQTSDNQVVMTLGHFQGPFLLLSLGFAAGIIILVFETIIAKYCT